MFCCCDKFAFPCILELRYQTIHILLQMFLPFINGSKAYPSCVADDKGNVIAVTHVANAKDLEEFFRIECVNMG